VPAGSQQERIAEEMAGVPEDAGEKAAIPVAASSHSDVIYFLTSRFLWVCATQVINVAVGWLVYDVTRSAWALGLVGLAAFAPKLVLALASGVVADRYDRRMIMAGCLVAMGITSLGLVFATLSSPVAVGAIYALFIVSGIARSFVGPASQAMIANLVPRQELSRVFGLITSASQLAAISGPAIGGFLFVLDAWVPFACASAALVVAGVLNLFIHAHSHARSKTPVGLTDAFAGLAFIWHRPVILGAISLDLFTVLLGGVTALLPIIASELLNVGPLGLGVLRSTPAVGAMMLGLWLSYRPIDRRAGPLLFAATTIFGLATIGLGLSSDFYISLALLWLIGAADVFSVVIRQTLVQSDTPDAMRGRVAAVNSLFVGASNELGEFESGATAALFGLVPAILVGGVGTIFVSVLWAVMFPQLRRRDRLVEPRAAQR
jgi:MFS family permease